MKVTVMFLGPLGVFIGQERVEFQLPDGAGYGDLLQDIGRRFADKFPPKVWDAEKNLFKGTILTIGTGRDLQDPETPLLEGEEIKFVPLLVGG